MDTTSFEITSLIDMLRRKALKLPEMQRGYVWKKERVRYLFDSLYRGYPTGTLLMWRTGEAVPTKEMAVLQNQQGTSLPEYLLLDGQQRLTSIYAVLTGEPAMLKTGPVNIDLLFNLEHPQDEEEEGEDANPASGGEAEDEDEEDEEEGAVAANVPKSGPMAKLAKLTFAVASKRAAALRNWISVSEFYKLGSVSEILRTKGFTPDNSNYRKYEKRLDQLREIWSKTSYPAQIIPMTTSHEEATEIFMRVNSGGSKLRSSDLALARITSVWRNSAKIFADFEREIDKEYPLNFGPDLYARNLIAFAEGKGDFETIRSLSAKQLEDAWGPSKKGMEHALNFLVRDVGARYPVLLTSPFTAIAIARFKHENGYEATEEETALLRYWALVANLKGRYSRGSTVTALNQDIASVKNHKGIEGIKSLISSLERQFSSALEVREEDLETDRKGAQFATMFMAFDKGGACDWKTQARIDLKPRGDSFAFEVHHIFPKKILGERGIPRGKINTICNFAFVGMETNRQIGAKKPEVYLDEFVKKNEGSKAFLEKQCIPPDPDLWKVESYEEFLKERRRLVAAHLNEFLAKPPLKRPEGA